MEIRFSERHIVALNFLLVAILAYFAALSVNDIVAIRLAPEPAAPRASAGPVRSAAVAHARSYYQAIVDRDVFNLVPQAQAPAPIVAEDLHLKLLGVSQLSGGKPFAVIEDRTGQQALYRTGEMIPGAGKLVEVGHDRVIIEHGGHRVALSLPKDDLPGPVVGPQGIPVPPAIDGSDDGDSSGQDFDPNVSDLGDNRYQVPRATIDHSLSHLSELVTQIRATPNLQNGKPNGFALSEIEPGSVFDEMGLQEGDVLKNVDGQQVTDPAQAMQMLNLLHNRSRINVQVLREGKPVTLNYQIE